MSLPLVTIGCNEIAGDNPIPWFCQCCVGCPYVACCGKIEPLRSCKLYPHCPGICSSEEDQEACCVCGCCLSLPMYLLGYFPCCLLSYCLPKGCINAGPCCWLGCDDCGGKGYDRSEWYDE